MRGCNHEFQSIKVMDLICGAPNGRHVERIGLYGYHRSTTQATFDVAGNCLDYVGADTGTHHTHKHVGLHLEQVLR